MNAMLSHRKIEQMKLNKYTVATYRGVKFQTYPWLEETVRRQHLFWQLFRVNNCWLQVFCDHLYLGGGVFCIICMQFTDPSDSVSSWATAWLGSRLWPDCKLHSAGNRPLKHTTLVSHVARSLCSWLRSVLLFSVPHSCYFFFFRALWKPDVIN